MSRIRQLIREAHRRSLWQVLGIYLAASWVAYEVVLNLTEGVGLPQWVPGFAIALLVVGLPVVLATAFVQEGAPELLGGRDDASAIPPGPAHSRGAEPKAARPSGAAESPVPSATAPSAGSRGVAGAERGLPAVARATGLRSLFTWRRAVLGGVGAFALLGVATVGYMAMRSLGVGPVGTLVAQGILAEREPILLGDFQSPTGDTLLAAVVTQVFRVDFAESPAVTLVEPAQVRQTLRLMRRDPLSELSPELAREVAERSGINALVEGEVGAAGAGYVLSGRLVETASGRVLATTRETARDSTALIDAVDRLSNRLRERIGESLKSLRGGEPLAAVTTTSLPALRSFTLASQALSAGDPQEAIALLEDAIARDSAFAMAHRMLGAALWNIGRGSAGFRAWRTALQYQDHLTDRERYHLVADYAFATGRFEEAVAAYERILRDNPGNHSALNNMGLAYFGLRDPVSAEEAFRRAIEAGTTFGGTYTNLFDALLLQGRLEDAEATLGVMAERVPSDPSLRWSQANLAAMRGQHDSALAVVERLGEEHRGDVAIQAPVAFMTGRFLLTRGRAAEASRELHAAAELEERQGRPGGALEREAERALLHALVRGDGARARAVLDSALARWPLDSLSIDERPYLVLALAHAESGRPEAARAVRERYGAEVDADLRRAEDWFSRVVDGALALAENRPAEAAATLGRAAETIWCGYCALPLLGRAHEGAGDVEAAVAAYEGYLADRHDGRAGLHQFTALAVMADPYRRAAIHERLGALYEQLGEPAKATGHYGQLAELWREADPELRPRAERAGRRLQALLARGG